MGDLIDRQAAIDALKNRWKKTRNYEGNGDDIAEECELYLKQVPSAHPEQDENDLDFVQPHKRIPVQLVVSSDCISRKAAIEAMEDVDWYHINKDGQLTHGANSKEDEPLYKAEDVYKVLNNMPSVQPTIYGYPVEHLVMIARILRKENLPPERVVEMLSDVGRIVEMVRDEFEETLRKAFEERIEE